MFDLFTDLVKSRDLTRFIPELYVVDVPCEQFISCNLLGIFRAVFKNGREELMRNIFAESKPVSKPVSKHNSETLGHQVKNVYAA